jgi:hypothetical protein
VRRAVRPVNTVADQDRPPIELSLPPGHSYATHLLEAGVNLRLIQQYPGDSALHTTMVYLHLTTVSHEQARARIEELMGP